MSAPFLLRHEAARARAIVFGSVKASGAQGVTSDEVERRTGLRHQTVSARLNELSHQGLVRDSRRRRPTSSGRLARVWVVA